MAVDEEAITSTQPSCRNQQRASSHPAWHLACCSPASFVGHALIGRDLLLVGLHAFLLWDSLVSPVRSDVIRFRKDAARRDYTLRTARAAEARH